jgi:hypothetical protein
VAKEKSMGAEREKEQTTLQKAESIAKIIGAVSVPIIGLIVTVVLHFNSESNREQQARLTEKNRRAQLFAEIMSQRERSDSDIRASMFNTLMANYLGSLSSGGQGKHSVEDLQRRIVFLNLLINNFQEYFNARPLFEDLYEQIARMSKTNGLNKNDLERLTAMKEDLIKVSKSAAKKQEVMLSRIGTSTDVTMEKGRHECISLYDISGLKMNGGGGLENLAEKYEGECTKTHKPNTDNTGAEASPLPVEEKDREEGEKKEENFNYSLDLTVTDIKQSEIDVKLTVYRDYFKDNIYEYAVVEKNDIAFSVSYFDLPFMDNTRLFSGSRFAITLLGIPAKDWAQIGVISFREEFMSLRDRPFFEEMLNKLQTDMPSGT